MDLVAEFGHSNTVIVPVMSSMAGFVKKLRKN